MRYKVAIIIPVYGVESYIEKCLFSAFNQTLENIQFIIINDATKDRSIEIAQNIRDKNYRKNDISIINKIQNQGLALARKTGLEYVDAEYILHLDSDDYFSSNDVVEKIYNKAKETDADLVLCDFTFEYPDGKQKIYTKNLSDLSKKGILNKLLLGEILPSLWSHLIKSTLYNENDIKFIKEVSSFGEDLIHIIQLVSYSKKNIYLKTSLIQYIQRVDSITSNNSKYFYQAPIANSFIENFVEKQNLYVEKEMEMYKIVNKHNLLRRVLFTPEYKEFLKINKKLDKTIWQNPYLSKPAKFRIYLYTKSQFLGFIYSKLINLVFKFLNLIRK